MPVPSLDLTDRVAIITGSGKGIGRALALGFVEAGARVVVNARTEADVDAVVGEIRAAGGKAIGVHGNVTVSSDVEALVEKTVAEWGRVDVLVNNAGGGVGNAGGRPYRSVLEIDEETWDRVVELNMKAPFLCSRAVGKIMVQQRSGSIINISSAQATWPTPENGAPYGAAKAGMEVLAKTLAQELGAYGVRVNTVIPGAVQTPSLERTFAEHPEVLQRAVARTPLGRMSVPEDLVGPVLFLASDASSYMSGATLLVRGGRLN
jgi:NAD(P)-dependent dehydrogenase (short-subunit alcohol dehydrogenase family)